MNLRHRSVLLLVSFAVTLSVAVPAFAGEPQWIEIQSPHFSVVTDAGEKRGREVAMRFEQMRAVFGTLLSKVNINIPIPLQIVAFRNTKEFRQVAPLWNGKPVELAGLFQGGEDRSFIMLDMSFYAESSLVMHYMYDKTLVPKLSDYFAWKIDKRVPVEEAIQKSFGMTAAQFDKALRDYLVDGRYRYYDLPTPANIVSKDYAMKPLSATDSSAVMADIHLHSRDYREKAIAEFQEILKTDPTNAGACRGLGYAYLQKQDFAQAGDYFKRAAQADSKDPRVHYYSAMLMSRQGGLANNSNGPEMITELQAAIALDPNFADPYALLSFAQMQAGDHAAALISIQKAIALSPRNENYQFNLAQTYLSNRKVDEAIAMLLTLQKSGNAEIASRAGISLGQAIEYREAIKASAANNLQGGRIELKTRDSAEAEATGSGTTTTVPVTKTPVGFLKGVVKAVDCSSPTSAALTVVSEMKSWQMQVADRKHVTLIGTDQFSCSWSRQKVALNYRATGSLTGSVVSIEVQ